MKALVVGNGPSAASLTVGDAIDAYPGKVIRINNGPFMAFKNRAALGWRTDIWATFVGAVDKPKIPPCEEVWIAAPDPIRQGQRHYAQVMKSAGAKVTQLPPALWRSLNLFVRKDQGGCSPPSTGMFVTAYCLDHLEWEVELWGFDHFDPDKGHHWWKNEVGGPKTKAGHHHAADKAWFDQAMERKPLTRWQPPR